MKKLLFVLAIGAFAACGTGTTTTNTTDSAATIDETPMTEDTTVAPMTDTTTVPMTTDSTMH